MTARLLTEVTLGMLRAHMRQSIVAAAGVTFGIAIFITLLSFMSGLNKLLDGLVLNRTPHIRIYNEASPNARQPVNINDAYKNNYNFINSVKISNTRQEIYNAEKIMQTLSRDPRVAGFSRKVATQVFFTDGPVDITGFMNGIDIESEMKLYKFHDYITGGDPMNLKYLSNSIILGKPLADKLRAVTGDVIQVTTVQGNRFLLKVAGYYQSGWNDFDKSQSFVSIETVQKILGKPRNYITDLQVKLHDLNQAPPIAREYAAIFQVKADDIQTANAQFETGTNVRNIISYAVGIALLIVAGFGIYNILNTMIYEKMDSIAILKATGYSGSDVKKIFMSISLGIGLFGCLVGILLGNFLTDVISRIPFNNPGIPTVKTYPVYKDPAFYFIAIFFSMATTWFAGWFPARKAGRVDPVAIIRGK